MEPTFYCKEFLHYLAHKDLCCQFPEMQGQNLFFYQLLKTPLSAQVLTHSWSPTGCLPPVGRPCQSQRCGCCSSHQGAGSRASGLCDCTKHHRTFLDCCDELLHFIESDSRRNSDIRSGIRSPLPPHYLVTGPPLRNPSLKSTNTKIAADIHGLMALNNSPARS